MRRLSKKESVEFKKMFPICGRTEAAMAARGFKTVYTNKRWVHPDGSIAIKKGRVVRVIRPDMV